MVMDPKTMRPVQSAASGVAPVVTLQPATQTANAGNTVTFTVAATGSPPLTVQWEISVSGGPFNKISGATDTSYTTPTLTLSDDGNEYRAEFSNAFGDAYTNVAKLAVIAAPVVTQDPADATKEPGETATFTASATGTPTPNRQWQLSTDGGSSWNDISGATFNSYTTPTLTAGDDGNQYRVVLTNTYGTATSNAATLTVDYFFEAEWLEVGADAFNPTDLLLN